MKLITVSKILLILLLPFLLLLSALRLVAFDSSFYQEKFLEYGVQKDIPEAFSLHESVVSFLKGANNQLPPVFNEREKQHLRDVRKIVNASTMLFYTLLALFVILLISSAFMLKINHLIMKFIGNVLLFGGLLTIILAGALLFFINSDFSSVFESLHSMLFQKGTYTFDPAREIIVRIYPEQLFMDLGIRILKWLAVGSAVTVSLGALLLLSSKKRFK